MSPFDRLFTLMTKPLAVVLYLSAIALLVFDFDKPIALYFYFLNLRIHLPILDFITRLGLGSIYIPTFFVLALFFRYIVVKREWEARAWFLLLCVAIPGIICLMLKVIFGRARPIALLYHHYGFYGIKWNAYYWSFPSGHTSAIMGVMLGLCIVFPRYFYAFLLVGIMVALTRVFLGHHFLSDILFAAYLALLEVGLLLCVLRRKSWLTPAWQDTI